METTHINNLISLTVEATVEAIQQTLPSEQKIECHLRTEELYGELPDSVIRHFINCITTISSHAKDGELKNYQNYV